MKTLVVAPHPDDELLGCGGTLLRRSKVAGSVGWLLMTGLTKQGGWSQEKICKRAAEIAEVRKGLGISEEHLFSLEFPTACLDQIPMSKLVSSVSEVFRAFKPEEVFLPYPGDAHSDHRITFEAVSACTKWFRYPSVRSVLAYETLSETDFGIDPKDTGFRPNVFVDISQQLEQKLELMRTYESEMGEFPFPRSEKAIRALARIRGLQTGFEAAEGFVLLRESRR